MQKFTKQLPKEDLKKFAKEIGKKLVASDFKNGRVEDPTKISEKQEKKVKKYVQDFFEKAVEKKKALDKRKREKAAMNGSSSSKPKDANGANGDSKLEPEQDVKDESDEEGDGENIDLTPNSPPAEFTQPSPPTPTPHTGDSSFSDLKRKRDESEFGTPGEDEESNKRHKEEDLSPPPPPPPPPAEGMPDEDMAEGVVKEETEEEKELRRQEEDLMRENEEAMKMDLDGSLKVEERESKLSHGNNLDTMKEANGNGVKAKQELSGKDSMEGVSTQ